MKYNNTSELDSKLEERAKEFIKKNRKEEIKDHRIQVFLLSEGKAVSFIKDSDGGLYGSKIYFEIETDDIDGLVNQINNQKWSSFRSKD